jgi:hypothetical protein
MQGWDGHTSAVARWIARCTAKDESGRSSVLAPADSRCRGGSADHSRAPPPLRAPASASATPRAKA